MNPKETQEASGTNMDRVRQGSITDSGGNACPPQTKRILEEIGVHNFGSRRLSWNALHKDCEVLCDRLKKTQK